MTSRSELDALLDRVRARCDEVGDCWEWRGALQHGVTTPTINYQNEPVGVRRLILRLQGVKVAGLVCTYKCGNRLCVAPEHLVAVKRGTMSRKNCEQIKRGALYRARIAERMRATRAVLTPEQVAEIRSLIGVIPQREMARRYGVSQFCISCIVKGKTWRDYSGPFAQLMTYSSR